MIVVAATAIPAWMARSADGRTYLVLAALLIGGLAVGIGLSLGLDWVVGLDAGRDRRD
jgi:hypothetical protein